MVFCSLSSSSVYGNSFLIRGADGTTIMIDCGIRLRRLEALLGATGVAPVALAGLFITHEHSDHTSALRLRKPFAVRHRVPVYAEPAFWRVWDGDRLGELPDALRREVSSGETIRVGGLSVRAVAKPHDTNSSIGFVVSDGDERVAVVTDLGHVNDDVARAIAGVEHIVIESNHDVTMELASGRPWPLINRVLGDRGHLSNEQCLAALLRVVGPRTRTVLLAHLSLDCNSPALVRRVVGGGLAAAGHCCTLEIAPPDRPTGWLPRFASESGE